MVEMRQLDSQLCSVENNSACLITLQCVIHVHRPLCLRKRFSLYCHLPIVVAFVHCCCLFQACENGRGAVLLSVARGKVSEGIDFGRYWLLELCVTCRSRKENGPKFNQRPFSIYRYHQILLTTHEIVQCKNKKILICFSNITTPCEK